MIWYIVGLFVVVIAAFLVWRYTSVARGARKRDMQLNSILEPVSKQLAVGEVPSPDQVAAIAASHPLRGILYHLLKHYERLDLFPDCFKGEIAQAEARLAYWMMHPNELQAAPEAIELVETVCQRIENENCRFHVFKFRMPKGHWAGEEWLLGVAGPYVDGEPPYTGIAGAFSRCSDKFGEVAPEELVGWYVAMATRR